MGIMMAVSILNLLIETGFLFPGLFAEAQSDMFTQVQLGQFIAYFSSLCIGLCVFFMIYIVIEIIQNSIEYQKNIDPDSYEEMQLNKIRKENVIFRYTEYLVHELENKFEQSPQLGQVEHQLLLLGKNPPWTASLYMAMKVVEGILVGIVGACFIYFFTNTILMTIVSIPIIILLYYILTLNILKDNTNSKKMEIKQRLPFIIDLMALSRGAGASFGESLQVSAMENADHPAGKIFKEAYQDFQYGKSSRQVMEDMADKMQDPDFDEITFAINKSDELGTPIAQTLSELADQMRLKRQQWGEKKAGEAEVSIVFPGFIIMIACMLIIVTPFILMAFYDMTGAT